MNPTEQLSLARSCCRHICTSRILLLLSLTLPAVVEAQFRYTITDGAITITGYTGPGGTVTIPSTINGLPVTSIGDSAFAYSGILCAVTIGNGVTNIGNLAFHDCPYLTNVTIPNSITKIGDGAFLYCEGLTEITVDVLNSVYSDMEGVLFDKSQTTLLQFPGGKAGGYIIPNGVVTIEDVAFDYCVNLTNITIPDSVTVITGTFDPCPDLTAISVDALNPAYSSVDGVLFNKNHTTLVEYPQFKIGDYTVPDSVTTIALGAFNGCRGLHNVTIPDSVTSIPPWAFSQCLNLTGVTIPNSVTDIGDSAFYDCISLTSITIPGSVTNIGVGVFQNCVCLKSITLGNGVINIGNYAFQTCPWLTRVYCQGNAPSLGSAVFDGDNNATVYYLPGTTGWGATYGGRATAPWVQVPTLLIPPQTQTAEAGLVVDLWAQATNAFPLFYLWYLNQTNLVSVRTNGELEFTNLQLAQSGAYTVVVSNVLGAITSAPVSLNVIAAVERRLVPGVKVTGDNASLLNVDSTDSLSATPIWSTLASTSLTSTSQYWFDLTLPLPPQRFYRVSQTGISSIALSLDLHMVPAITLTGNIGDSLRLDYINRYGPTDAWVTLDRVTLTNTSQLYFDTSAIGQPPRLWRTVALP